MEIKIKKRTLLEISNFLMSALFALFLFLGVSFVTESAMGANVTNATVLAKVNISNTEPSLYNVKIDHPFDLLGNIDLTPNAATVVVCNGSASDINGYDDIKNVSATFYLDSVASNAVDDNNTHYTNGTCGNCSAVAGTNNQNATCLCQFAVQYYANAGLWRCNMTINDSGGIISSRNSTLYNLNSILGISVENNVMDFGNLSVSQVSGYLRQNVTNTGNTPINVTVRGYGGDNESIGQNVSMICQAGANITFGNQRYYPGNNTAFDQMHNLTNQTIEILNLTIPQRTNDIIPGNSTNSTFWRLQIPIGASGICNGTIIFGALDAS